MSNLVLQADRSLIARRAKDEGTGEAESLWGKINPKEFGSKAAMSFAEEKAKREAKRAEKEAKRSKKSASTDRKEYFLCF